MRWTGVFFRNWNYNLRFFVWILKLTWSRQHLQLRWMLWQSLIAVASRMFVFFTLFNCFPFSYCKPRQKFLFRSGVRFFKFLNELFNGSFQCLYFLGHRTSFYMIPKFLCDYFFGKVSHIRTPSQTHIIEGLVNFWWLLFYSDYRIEPFLLGFWKKKKNV